MGPPTGYRNIKNASSVIILIMGLSLLGGFAGCMFLLRSAADRDSPGMQAIKSDLRRIAEHRIVYTIDGDEFVRIKRPPVHPGTPMEDSPPPDQKLPDDILIGYDILEILWGDVDGDHGSDLVLLYGNKGDEIRINVRTWTGEEFVTFWESEPILAETISLEDVNGDGIADIVVT